MLSLGLAANFATCSHLLGRATTRHNAFHLLHLVVNLFNIIVKITHTYKIVVLVLEPHVLGAAKVPILLLKQISELVLQILRLILTLALLVGYHATSNGMVHVLCLVHAQRIEPCLLSALPTSIAIA